MSDCLNFNNIQKELMPNGTKLFFDRCNSSNLLSVQVWVKAGSIYEGDLLGSGVSHFVEHMLFKGTPFFGANQLSKTIESCGGLMNAYTHFDRTVFYISLPPENAQFAFDILSKMIYFSSFNDEDITLEKQVVLNEIDMYEDDLDSVLNTQLFKLAYNNSNYKYPVIGERKLFESLTNEQIVSYYKKRYSPQNISLFVSGDISFSKVKLLAKKYFSKQEGSLLKNVDFLPSQNEQVARRVFEKSVSSNITRVSVAWKIPNVFCKENPAFFALCNILASGRSSVLWKKIVEEKKLAFYICAYTWAPSDKGLFVISFECSKNKKNKVLSEIFSVLNSIEACQDISKDSIDKCIKQTIFNDINSSESLNGKVTKMAIACFVLEEENFFEAYLQRLKSLEANDLIEASKKYLKEQNCSLVSLNAKGEKTSIKNTKSSKKPNAFVEEKIEGVSCLFQEIKESQKFSIRALYKAGCFLDGDKRGLSRLTIYSMIRAYSGISPKDLSLKIDDLALSLLDYSSNNTSGFSIESLDDYSNEALDIFLNLITKPSFDKESFEIEKTSCLSSIEESLDDCEAFAKKQMRKIFFKNTPYSSDMLGEKKDILSISQLDCKKFYEKYLGKNNLIISISGNFNKNNIKKILSEKLKNLHIGIDLKIPPKFSLKSPIVFKDKSSFEQSVCILAFQTSGVLNHKESLLCDFFDEAFNMMSSNLFNELREKRGLAYMLGSGRIACFEAGIFYLQALVKSKDVDLVFKKMKTELKRISKGQFFEGEIDSVKTYMKARLLGASELLSNRTLTISLEKAYSYKINNNLYIKDEIDALCESDISSFAKKLFDFDKSVEYSLIGKD